jgi:hypothetical protein
MLSALLVKLLSIQSTYLNERFAQLAGKRELFRNRSRTLMQSTEALRLHTKSRALEMGLMLHVATSARVQPANEFIVCALTRIKRHVYDKLKQPTACGDQRDPGCDYPASREQFFSLVLPPIVRICNQPAQLPAEVKEKLLAFLQRPIILAA